MPGLPLPIQGSRRLEPPSITSAEQVGQPAVLDVSPPALTWGPVRDAVAAERMTIEYALNEGAVVSAELHTAAKAPLTMEIFPGTLEIDVPADVRDGPAMVYATVRDQWGNEAVYTLQVSIVGTFGAPPPRVGGLPSPGPETFRTTARIVVSTSGRVTVRRRERVAVRVATRAQATHRMEFKVGVAIRATTRVQATRRAELRLRAEATAVTRRTSEGRSHEDELIAIGLL